MSVKRQAEESVFPQGVSAYLALQEFGKRTQQADERVSGLLEPVELTLRQKMRPLNDAAFLNLLDG